MAQEVGQIQFKVGLKNGQNVLNEVNNLSDKVNNNLGVSFGKLGALIGAAFSVKAILDFGRACSDAYKTSVEYQTKLETVFRQRMNASNEELASIRELASELQGIGVIEDDIAAAGMQQLGTFITSTETAEQLLPALENLVAQQKGYNATAGDAVNIGNLMGKVMTGNTSALTRVGIVFSEAQEQIIKYGNEEERAAALAQIITDNVGEMNEALGNTPQGKMLQISNAWGDMQENIGSLIQSALYPFLDTVADIVNYLNRATAKLAEFAQTWAGITNTTITTSVNVDGIEEGVEQVNEELTKTSFGFDNLNKLSGGTSSNLSSGSSTIAGNTTSNNEENAANVLGFKFDFNERELEAFQNIFDNIRNTFNNLIRIANTLGGMFSYAFDTVVIQTFLEHSDALRGIFQDLLYAVEDVTKTFDGFIARSSAKLEAFAGGRFVEACATMKQHFNEALLIFEFLWDTIVMPLIDVFLTKFNQVFGDGGTLDECFDRFLEDVAIIMENSGWLMNLLAAIGAIVAAIFVAIGTLFMSLVTYIVESITNGMDLIAGLFLVLQGIADGSWEKIKEGFLKMLSSIIDQFITSIRPLLDLFNISFDSSSLMSSFETPKTTNPSVSTVTNGSGGGLRRFDSSTTTGTANNKPAEIYLTLDGNTIAKTTGEINERNEWVSGSSSHGGGGSRR